MTWDEDGRLQSVIDNAGQPTTFKYDGDTNRVVKKGAGGETLYINPWYVAALGRNSKQIFAGTTRIATKLEISPTGEGYGPGAKNLKEVAQYFYHQDHLGSTGFATDATGEVWQHLEYFPFGETWVDEVSDDTRVPYRFTGQELDQETKLYYHGARYYDPKTSVWQNPDPALGRYLNSTKTGPAMPSLANDWRVDTAGLGLGGVFNPLNLNNFGYAHQSPVKLSDPNGEWVWLATGAIGAGISTSLYVGRQLYVGEKITTEGVLTSAGVGFAMGSGAVLIPGITAAVATGLTTVQAASVAVRATNYSESSPEEQRAIQADAFLLVAGVAGGKVLGSETLAKPFVPKGATEGTSVSSVIARDVFGNAKFDSPKAAPIGMNPFSPKFYKQSMRIGTSVGRTAPYTASGLIAGSNRGAVMIEGGIDWAAGNLSTAQQKDVP